MHLTPTLRRFDGGVMELGLEYTDKMAIPPQQPAFIISGYCITECTAVVCASLISHTLNCVSEHPVTSHAALWLQAVPQEGIIIFGSQLHTHLTGIRVFTRHIRDGRELPELNRDNHYSTHFQEIRSLKRQVRVLPVSEDHLSVCQDTCIISNRRTLGLVILSSLQSTPRLQNWTGWHYIMIPSV
jgi:dopamine beta-monooxygenase